MGHDIKPVKQECKLVPKGWGHEIIFANNELYCGKLLVFKAGSKFSMHYHLIKDETWYVQEGRFLHRWIDTEVGLTHEDKLGAGDVIRQRVGQPHQLLAYTDGVILEVSTQHFDSDNYRVYAGDSQRNEIES